MSDLVKRSLTGVLFTATVIGCTIWNKYAFASLFFVVLLFGLGEFNKFVAKYNDEKKNPFVLYIIGIVMYGSFYAAAYMNLTLYLLACLPLISILFISEIFRSDANHFKRTATTVMGVVYLILPLSLLSFMGSFKSDFNSELILGYIVLIWANDTGAYIFGVSMGKHKLFERISAKKTWEGAIGGAVTALGVAYGISVYTSTLNLVHWLAIALLTVIFGSLGDLVESSMKRTVGIKDSGDILPGHGGVLDRFDGLLISVPVVVTYLYLFA